MQRTGIEYADFTANPIKAKRKSDGKVGHFCVKKSEGYKNCYSEQYNKRNLPACGIGLSFTKPNLDEIEWYWDDKEAERLLKSKAISGGVVFLCDMTDWMLAPEWMRDRLVAICALRCDVTFLLLTKRAAQMREYLEQKNVEDNILHHIVYQDEYYCPICMEWFSETDEKDYCPNCGEDYIPSGDESCPNCGETGYESNCPKCGIDGGNGGLDTSECWHTEIRYQWLNNWPLPNVWLGVTAENQETADTRIPHLIATPSAVRFVSAEPLLGPINFRWTNYQLDATGEDYRQYAERNGSVNEYESLKYINLVITGCESGPGKRPSDLSWHKSINDQCKAAGVAVFNKQFNIGGKIVKKVDDTRWPVFATREMPGKEGKK